MERVLTWDDWQGLVLGEPDWLIQGLLERGGGALVHGGTQTYKSFLMLQVCLDLAAGLPVLDVFPATSPHPTIMFQAEGTRRAWRQRMLNLRNRYDAGIPFWSAHINTAKFDSTAGDLYMRAVLALVKPALLVLDPIADFFTGTDTDAVAVERWTGLVNAWRTEFGCAIALVHHDRQPTRFFAKGGMVVLDAGLEEARGHTRLPAWADLVLGLRRHDDTTTVQVQKVRDGAGGAEYAFKLEQGRLVLASRTDSVELAVLAALAASECWLADVTRTVSERVGVQDRTVRRVVQRLIERGQVEQTSVSGRFKLKRIGREDK